MTKKKNKGWLYFGLILLISILASIFNPHKAPVIFQTSLDYFIQMVIIFPAVLILMGLFSVWISNEFIISHLGKNSGLKGILISFVLGTIPTGPLFIAFPIARTIWRKGARTSNIVVFLSAWACIKIPQELVELQFMGVNFMAVRLILSIVFITLMGFVIDRMIKKKEEL
ncbi:MAG: hypothetical protein APR54_10425 [Candidatus Cloacimonas sp. SDB]|nr:MAG: hypothetical protein APR54_10425 [Candidatus Cloacimonas sp. SDB]